MNRTSTIVLLALLTLISSVSQASTLSIVAKEEAPYFGKNLPQQGLSAEIVQTALNHAGFTSDISYKTWPRAYEGAQIGVFDILGSIWKTDFRSQDFAFSEPYLFHEIQFIRRQDDAQYIFKSLKDLDGLIIGTLKGYAYRRDFLKDRSFIKVPQNQLLQNLLKLTKGEIDLTLGDKRKITYELNQFMKGSIDKLRLLPTPLARNAVHIAISKENPQHKAILERFNQALKAMKSDGSYQKIIDKHRSSLIPVPD